MEARVCLVVGMGRGIGLSVARRFGQEGYRLGLIARSEASLENYAGALELDGHTVEGYPADVARPQQLISAVRQAEKQLGPIEVLIYNAYASQGCRASELRPEALEQTLQVNLYGALVAAQLVIPGMLSRRKGTLLFTGGGLALNPQPDRKEVGIGGYFNPSGNIEADFAQIRDFYADKVGKNPSKQSPIRLKPKNGEIPS